MSVNKIVGITRLLLASVLVVAPVNLYGGFTGYVDHDV